MTLALCLHVFFHTSIGRPSSPSAVLPFAALSARSVSSSEMGSHGISSFPWDEVSCVGSFVHCGKEILHERPGFVFVVSIFRLPNHKWGDDGVIISGCCVFSCLP
jgi:hypothetical protein